MIFLVVLLVAVLAFILVINRYFLMSKRHQGLQRRAANDTRAQLPRGITFHGFLNDAVGRLIKSFRYGGSYVLIFKIANIIIAIFVGMFVDTFISSPVGQAITDGSSDASAFLGVIAGIVWWYFWNLFIKVFENIRTIAKNSSDTVAIARKIEEELHYQD